MLTLYEYQLPFARPFRTAKTEFTHRTGIILRFNEHQHELLSEAAPLPGFSIETTHQIKKTLISGQASLNKFLQSDYSLADLKNYLDECPSYPSLQWAVSFLGLAILSRRKETAIAKLLGLQPVKRLIVNETIGHATTDTVYSKISEAAKNGFTTIKIKTTSSPEKLASILAKASERYKHIHFRIDANQSWPEDNIRQYSALFTGSRIQYIEEPAPVTDPGRYRDLQAICAFPIALDESIKSPEMLQSFLETDPELFVVIKPMLYGSIFKLVETIRLKRSTHKNVVVTTTLESKIGRSMAAVTASLIGDPATAHGLNTGHFFKQDLNPDFPAIKKGLIADPETEYNLCSFQKIETSLIKLLDD